MKIAVTGSSGFIGKNLVKRLKIENYEIIEIDFDKGFNLLDINSLNKIPKYDLVIHLAAKTFVPSSFTNPGEFYNNNILATLNILELTRKFGARFVYLSSYVYGEPKYLPIDENHPFKAHNPYSQSKLICEKLCEGYNRDFQVPITIFRPFNVYGFEQNTSFLIPSILEQYKTGVIELKDPRPKRDFVYISDVVDAIIAGLKINNSFSIYNIGYGNSYSIQEIIDIILKYTKNNIIVKFTNEFRNEEVLNTVADISKIKKDLNWSPKISLEDGINKILKMIN